MKRALSLAFVLVLVLGVACSPGLAQGYRRFEGVKLEFIMVDDPQVYAIRRLLPEFKKLTGVEVTITEYPLSSLMEKQLLSLISGTGKPDLVGFDLWFTGAFGRTDTLLSLDSFIKELKNDRDFDFGDLLPRHVEGYRYRNHQIGVGFIPVQMLQVYRKDLFDSAKYKAEFKAKYGYDLKPPETMKQFMDVVKFFTRDTDGDGKIDLWGNATQMQRDDPIYCAFTHFMYPYGGEIIDPKTKRPVFNSKTNVRALTDFVTMVHNYCPPGTLGYGWGDMTAAMQKGDVAIQLNWNVFMGEYEDPSKSQVAGKLGYTPTPGEVTKRSLLGGWGIGINKQSRNKEAAKEFIRWLLSKETDLAVTLSGGAAPMRVSTYKNPEVAKRFPHGPASNLTATYSTPPPSVPEFPAILEIVGLTLSEAASKQKSPKEALDEGQAKLDDVMRNAGYYK